MNLTSNLTTCLRLILVLSTLQYLYTLSGLSFDLHFPFKIMHLFVIFSLEKKYCLYVAFQATEFNDGKS
jgi:hypothetical protein